MSAMWFEWTNIENPWEQDNESITCGSNLASKIDDFIKINWGMLDYNSLNKIHEGLNNEINACQQKTSSSFAEMNLEMYQKWITIYNGYDSETRFLGEQGIYKADLENFLWDTPLPNQYSIRISWDTVIIHGTNGIPIAEYDKNTKEYSAGWIFTWNDNLDDNVNGDFYIGREKVLQWENGTMVWEAFDDYLGTNTITISDLNNPDTLGLTARTYDIHEDILKWALNILMNNTSIRSDIFNISRLSNWGFNLSIGENNKRYIANFDMNWNMFEAHQYP
jgi:hypothetical protein